MKRSLCRCHQKAQWTVGKLHCGNCSARLGGFNFINHSRCPCGQNITVHLSKSRVDRDPVLGFPPRGTRPAPEEPGLSHSGGGQGGLDPAPAPSRDSPAGPPPPGCDVMSCLTSATQSTPTYAQASSSSSSLRVSDGEAGQTVRHATSKCCVPHRTGRRLPAPGLDVALGASSTSAPTSSALYTPGPPERLLTAWAETDRSPRLAAGLLHQVTPLPGDTAGGPLPGPAPPPPPPPPASDPEEAAGSLPRDRPEVPPGVVVSPPTEDPPDSPMFLRGRTITDSIGELAAPLPVKESYLFTLMMNTIHWLSFIGCHFYSICTML